MEAQNTIIDLCSPDNSSDVDFQDVKKSSESSSTCVASCIRTCHFGMEELELLSRSDDMFIGFLQYKGLIARGSTCTNCYSPMQIVRDNNWFWGCHRSHNKVRCMTFKFPIRKGPVFEHSKLSLNNLFRLIYNFSRGHEPKDVARSNGVGTSATVITFYNKIHHTVIQWMQGRGLEELRPLEVARAQHTEIHLTQIPQAKVNVHRQLVGMNDMLCVPCNILSTMHPLSVWS